MLITKNLEKFSNKAYIRILIKVWSYKPSPEESLVWQNFFMLFIAVDIIMYGSRHLLNIHAHRVNIHKLHLWNHRASIASRYTL